MTPIFLAELSSSEPLLSSMVTSPVYTFGQPRGGNEAYAAWASETFSIYRVVHHDDPVPHLPPPALGFVAVGSAIRTILFVCVPVWSSGKF